MRAEVDPRNSPRRTPVSRKVLLASNAAWVCGSGALTMWAAVNIAGVAGDRSLVDVAAPVVRGRAQLSLASD